MRTATCLVLLTGTGALLVADPERDGKGKVVRELGVKVDGPARGQATEPTVIRTADELAKAIPDEAVAAAIRKAVNFEKEQVVYFAWSGSGQDKLTQSVQQEKAGPAVHFVYAAGRTRDVRAHHRLFALPKDTPHKVVTAGR